MSWQAGQRLGRFELLAVGGRGAQATVWRARDPALQRDVALKILNPDGTAALPEDWRAEAHLAGSLHHPGIVPVFEVVDTDVGVAIVSEWVQGVTLSEALRRQGVPASRDAVRWVREVLDALAHAHAHGVVHRDLKASNVMLDTEGRVRVLDFGVAARLGAAADGRIVGSPSTLSPEAAAGAAPAASMDVFAAGLLLGELLVGRAWRPPLAEAALVIHRALHEPVCWPQEAAVEVDDVLRAVVLRATSLEPTGRWSDAAAMRDALDDWLQPPALALAPATHSTLGFLMRRMRLYGDFPALSDAVLRIQRVASSDKESVHALAAEILRDVALTQRLLRVVNTAHFRLAHQGEISTVSRAAALVGFAGIRTMALSLLLVEHMGNRAHAERMKGLCLEALLTATLVDQLTPPSREREEAFLAGMFSHLGRLLVEYYLPDEAQHVRSASGQDSERIETDVLGLSYAALGQGVAHSWGLPASLRHSMSRPTGEPPSQAVQAPAELMRWRVRAAGELVTGLLNGESARPRLDELAGRYAPALGLSRQALLVAVDTARLHLADLASGLGLSVGARAPAARLLPPGAPAEATTVNLAPVPSVAASLLAAGIADVAASLAADHMDRGEVLRTVLETIWRSLGFDRVMMALRDPKQSCLLGRMGLGEGAASLCAQWRVELRPGPPTDLFTLACDKGVDTWIEDARAASMQARLPAWCRALAPSSLLVLPVMLKGQAIALIYADSSQPSLTLGPGELQQVRTLRNQVVLAFRLA